MPEMKQGNIDHTSNLCNILKIILIKYYFKFYLFLDIKKKSFYLFFSTKHFIYITVNCFHYDSNSRSFSSLFPTFLKNSIFYHTSVRHADL